MITLKPPTSSLPVRRQLWLMRTDIAIRATKLNAQVQLTNLQTMYERGTATSDQRRQLDLEYQDWARLQGRGPHAAGGHGRNRHVGWQGQVRSGQVRYITRPKSEAMRVTRQLRLPPRNRWVCI